MTDSSYYEAYWKGVSGSEWTPSSGNATRDEKELFGKYLPPGACCLDYGCGNAKRYGLALATSGVDYRGFDVSEHALAEARAAGVNVNLLDADGRTSLPDATADTAICFEVLEHLMEPGRALDELRRCVKPGGHVLVSVPNTANFIQRLEFLFTGFWCPGGSPHTARREPWRDPHIRFYNPHTLRRLLAENGWEVVAFRGERFFLCSLPIVWRKKEFHPCLNWLSLPFAWMGRVFPGLFSWRLFVVGRKAT